MENLPDSTPRSQFSQLTKTNRFNRVSLIADPIHGYIEVTKGTGSDPGERDIIDTLWLQRLRRIHQLQTAWLIFPSAEHSRFVHLLGAMHLTSLFARQVDASLRDNFSDAPSPTCVEETLRLAGLFHDIGHGPFGHFFDQEVLSKWNIDHEDVGRHIVTHKLADLIRNIRTSPNGRFASGESIDPMWVAWIMADSELPGYTPPAWLAVLKPILCGPVTVDNLDYVPRDAYMTGVSMGSVDIQRIIHYTFIHDGTLVLHLNASGAFEMFLASRLFMYTNVYHHHTGRRFDLSLHDIFQPTISLLLPGIPMEYMEEYLRLSDWSVFENVQQWQNEPPGSEKHTLAQRWSRILSRDLPWHLAHESIAHSATDLSTLKERIRDHLPHSFHHINFEVDIASAKIAPLNPMTDDGLVAIFDPKVGIEHKQTAKLVARLPQYNRTVRVFTDDKDSVSALHEASDLALIS